jgi:hypothetical protein
MSTRTRHRHPAARRGRDNTELESPEGIQRGQCLLADSIEPLQGGPAETYELEFHSDQGDLFPNRRKRDLRACGYQKGRDTGHPKRARLP